MNSEKIRKYVMPSLPYAFVFWFFSKLGEAYRNASGADMLHKIMGSMMTLSKAMAKPLPSFNPYDLLVGIVGAVIVYIVVYFKKKNAKKFRKDIEYGSARWGKQEDINPYLDPTTENNIILTQTESLTMNSRPSSPKYARNKNVMIIGGSGSGKTRFWLKPNLMQMHSSYVITDPKGTVLIECGKLLKRGTPKTAPKIGKDGKPVKNKRGETVFEVVRNKKGKIVYEPYEIKVLNTIDFSKSMRYNPFALLYKGGKTNTPQIQGSSAICDTFGRTRINGDITPTSKHPLYKQGIFYFHQQEGMHLEKHRYKRS